ncbi:unnamed protein product [Lactuca virosa]|uniref:S-protein homolog n=1 Tax=Lactuca virosa TaxID=75947 RepID=A0AAU9LR97_9ASTR|nr:unnamed protein product [Lactuca virosa]
MKLDPKESNITLLEIKNFPSFTRVDLVCSGENLYVLQNPTVFCSQPQIKAHKLDFGEMKWVVLDENTSQEYAFFLCYRSQGAVVKPQSWWQQGFRMSRVEDLCGNERFFQTDDMWYFPHEYRDINRMDE